MRLVAAVDVGNSTTEVVLADLDVDPPAPLAWDSAPTRGRKGSEPAALAAAGLVQRLLRRARLDVPLAAVLVAPQRPVDLMTMPAPGATVGTGRLRPVGVLGTTPGRAGLGVGRPWPLSSGALPGEVPPAGPLVLVATAEVAYGDVAAELDAMAASGRDVRAALLAADEGVLVARRSSALVPVLDEVDVTALAGADRVLVEVAEPGAAVRRASDPLQLLRLLELDAAERGDAAQAAAACAGRRAVVVARTAPGRGAPASAAAAASAAQRPQVLLRSGERLDLVAAAADPPGCGGVVGLTGVPATAGARPDVPLPAADVLAVDLAAVRRAVHVPAGAGVGVPGRAPDTVPAPLLVAALAVGLTAPADGVADAGDDPAAVLREELGAPVCVPCAETAAALAGARSTPGADPRATVVDLGGGTVDAVVEGPDGAPLAGSAAGGGELLTAAVADLLGLPRGAAEWVKRGPAARVEAPQLVLDEDGTRRFLEHPTGSGAVGRLVVPGPAGLLPFAPDLAPAQWRALRREAKRVTVARSAARALAASSRASGPATRGAGSGSIQVLLVGGAAADPELRELLALHLPGAVVATADVAGRLGHRYAVAYGLILAASGA